MAYKRFYILVEGSDDERFVKNILNPVLHEKYDSVQIYKYSGKTSKKIIMLLNSIASMGADYIYLCDMDSTPCVTVKKEKVASMISNIRIDRIGIVIKEIEGWYFAGLNIDAVREIGISSFPNTNSMTKEEFDRLIPRRFVSRIDFMIELLKYYSIGNAKNNNESLRYCINKF
jgi:hypothetical protein